MEGENIHRQCSRTISELLKRAYLICCNAFSLDTNTSNCLTGRTVRDMMKACNTPMQLTKNPAEFELQLRALICVQCKKIK